MDNLMGNNARIKELNVEIVREALKSLGRATKQKLVSVSGLSHIACGSVLEELLEAGEVIQLMQGENGTRRHIQKYAYNFNYAQICGIALFSEHGCRRVVMVLANSGGKILERREFDFAKLPPEKLRELVRDMMTDYPAIKVISLSYPGPVLNGVTASYGDFPELYNFPAAEFLMAEFGVKVLIENDVNMAALGIGGKFSSKSNENVVLYIALPFGNCPGIGIVGNGGIIRGAHGFAGEALFFPLQVDSAMEVQNEPTFDGAVNQIADLVQALIALIDPGVIVISGRGVTTEIFEMVKIRCHGKFAGRIMPEFEHRYDYREDCLKGIVGQGVESLRSPLCLCRNYK